MRTLGMVFGSAALLAACTVKDPLYCRSDFDCKDNADRPRCDLTGDHEENHLAHTCVANWDPDAGLPDAPADAPVDATQICAPSSATCANDVLTTCSADGTSKTDTPCALGCFTDGTRCYDVDPSNGLAAALDDSVNGPDLVLTDGAVVDTDNGNVVDGNGSLVSVPSEAIVQGEGLATIRVFKVRSLRLGSTSVVGMNAVAFVSNGDVVLVGEFSIAAHGTSPGPGGYGGGGSNYSLTPTGGNQYAGGGGAGMGDLGASGGSNGTVTGGARGGTVASSLEPLGGGSAGGYVLRDFTVISLAGAGGGAVQLVSRSSIRIIADAGHVGRIHAGGGAGPALGGGAGAGGAILLEAPQVLITGAGVVVAANGGGGGGGCSAAGSDGTASGASAPGGQCSTSTTTSGGAGGTGSLPAIAGTSFASATPNGHAGGGGGGAGILRVNTNSGFTVGPGASVSARTSQGTLRKR